MQNKWPDGEGGFFYSVIDSDEIMYNNDNNDGQTIGEWFKENVPTPDPIHKDQTQLGRSSSSQCLA